ncbi:MAG: class I SAM-dependent methyltransferase [Chloroflexi bacterium]|nr:class I SAM-dependent methyltransferase [Chloroflexota bacterium]
MTHAELVNLIRAGVPDQGGVWADFGAGGGNFTRALHDLLGSAATIFAVDRDGRALERLQASWLGGEAAALHIRTADFTQPLALPPLDGLLVANALHFNRDQAGAVARLAGYLRRGGRFMIVEYEVNSARSYIPFPLPYARFERLMIGAGLGDVVRVGLRRSPSSGTAMYAAAAIKP